MLGSATTNTVDRCHTVTDGLFHLLGMMVTTDQSAELYSIDYSAGIEVVCDNEGFPRTTPVCDVATAVVGPSA